MNRRGVETVLAYWTLFILLFYVPLETWTSWSDGLLNPFYLVDVVAMILLFWGAVHSLRLRPVSSPNLLCIGTAWACANGWRATSWRLHEIQAGGTLTHGTAEIWVVGVSTAIGLLMFIALLVLVVMNQEK